MVSSLQIFLQNNHVISNTVLLRFISEINTAMSFLDEHNILHRDLSTRNILLNYTGKVKLTDFGMAVFLNENQTNYIDKSGFMPIKWAAPEVLFEGTFSRKSEVWAFGVVCWEIYSSVILILIFFSF